MDVVAAAAAATVEGALGACVVSAHTHATDA